MHAPSLPHVACVHHESRLATWHTVSCSQRLLLWPRCLGVTPGGYAELARHCAGLQELRAYACAAVDDAALEALAALPQLRLLDICGAHLVTGMPGGMPCAESGELCCHMGLLTSGVACEQWLECCMQCPF